MSAPIIGAIISLAVSAALVSGVQFAHDVAFFVAAALTVLSWVMFLPACLLSLDKKGEIIHGWAWKSPITVIYWGALVYSGHPYIFAASVIFFVTFISVYLGERSGVAK